MIKVRKDLTGQKFGRWTVLRRVDDYVKPSGKHEPMWLCKCKCGTIKPVNQYSLTRSVSLSCGCITAEKASKNFKKQRRWFLSSKKCIGYTSDGEEFYFDLKDFHKI